MMSMQGRWRIFVRCKVCRRGWPNGILERVSKMKSVHLIIPDLFLPGEYASEACAGMSLPALEAMLARGSSETIAPATLEDLLWTLFRMPSRDDASVASVSAAFDGLGPGCWMRADPVHLRAGLNDLTLIDATDITLSQHDAILLGTPLHEIFSESGWLFEIPMAKRWYLKLDDYPDAETTEIGAVRGRDVQHLMPQGGDRPRLERIMTEVQMTLHNNQHNLEREWRGEPVLNSLWFWGCGRLPENLDTRFSKIISDDPVARGLATLAGIPFTSPPEDLETLLQDTGGSDSLLIARDDLDVNVSYQDFGSWEQAMLALEDDWFAPALHALQQGDLDRVAIIGTGMEYRIGWYSLKKFWCRNRAVI